MILCTLSPSDATTLSHFLYHTTVRLEGVAFSHLKTPQYGNTGRATNTIFNADVLSKFSLVSQIFNKAESKNLVLSVVYFCKIENYTLDMESLSK